MSISRIKPHFKAGTHEVTSRQVACSCLHEDLLVIATIF